MHLLKDVYPRTSYRAYRALSKMKMLGLLFKYYEEFQDTDS